MRKIQIFCIIQKIRIYEGALMKEFTFSDLSRRSGDVLDAALVEKVALAKRGKPKVMMMPIDEYERLERMAAGRRERNAFTLADAPQEDLDNLAAGFQQILDEAGEPDA
ncbi:type II toxin-antitoxin system prevent-host-death family antitoxin [Aliihoeflea sp. 40Bstr573]|uniref:type II toxin-antitoxin system prevent-host-death family antitoxin n=1 Tax=Aliihoeflea sp. 40Bstr573 TaxID=2696467 RepID=UPI00209612BF|nr:type II toxin-antitoxin system prevent-host-death family antitoxin [Aliihoeflea sp. 40Bstr573]MCO6389371.1 type II toxin-antitoxin system prevent-host-death family antitoxin [Aliihoeflea sp. 40Bstr573]